MKSSYNTSTNYYKINNRNYPYMKKSNNKTNTDSNGQKKNFTSNDLHFISIHEDLDNILSKALSKKKKRGILDMASPGNKDVLTDSDSELPESKNNKNMEIVNRNSHKKNGCAKLIIEKVESQAPQKNEEYYKFTNQKKYDNNYNINNNKKRINNNSIYYNSSPNEMNAEYLKNKPKYSYKTTNINYKSNNFQNYENTNQKEYPNQIKNKGIYFNSNYKKKMNYSQNKILNSESNIRKDNNYMSNEKNRMNLGNSNNSLEDNYYFNINKSPYIHNSTESSVDKGSVSMKYIDNNNILNLKQNIFRESSFNTPTPILSNTEDSYQNNKNKKKNSFISRPQKTISLYNDYKNVNNKPLMNQLINLNYNTQSSKPYLQAKFNEKLIKGITKIQSFWRGAFIRELMTFVGKLNKFINILYRIFYNNLKLNFYYFLNTLKNYQKPKNKRINLKNPSLRHKYIYSKEKINKSFNKTENNDTDLKNKNQDIVTKNDENYNSLLNNYNNLMDKYNKLKEEFDNLNKENKKNIDIINKLEKKQNIINKTQKKNLLFDNLSISKNNFKIIDKKIKKKEKKIDEKKDIFDNSDINGNNLEVTDKKDKKLRNKMGKRNNQIILQNLSINKNNFSIIDKKGKKISKKNDKKTQFNNLKINKNNFGIIDNKYKKDKKLRYKNDKTDKKNINKDLCIYNDNFGIVQKKDSKKIENIIPQKKAFDMLDIDNNNLEIIDKKNKKIKNKKINDTKKSFTINKHDFGIIIKKDKNVEKKIEKKKVFDMLDIDNNNLEVIDKKGKKIKNKNEQKNNFDKLDINKNDKKNIFSKLYIDNNNNNLNIINKKNKIDNEKNNKEINKQFDIIEPVQKEELTIIQNSNNNNLRSRGKKSNKKEPENIEKESEIKSENENKEKTINYEDYLNHFKSNINITNNAQFNIEQSSNTNKKDSKKTYYISNNNMSIIGKGKKNKKLKKTKKEKKEKEKEEEKSIPKIFANVSINKIQNNEITIINEIKKEKKPELVKENQVNLNTEIKPLENNKIKKFKDTIVNEHNNNINIIQEKQPYNFDKNLMHTKNDILLNIISEHKPKKEKDFNNLIIADNININILTDNTNKNNDKDDKLEQNKIDEEKKEDKLLEETNKIKRFYDILMIDNNNILNIKRIKKKKCDKITEITEELNKIEPDNHYELIFKGILNLEKMNISQSNNTINNDNKEIVKEKEETISPTKEEKIEDVNTKKKDYNEGNEIHIAGGLEINPVELKRTKNNPNNIFISYEDKIEVLYNKNAIFTEKAKRNLMKIILPIRLKTTLREYIRKQIYPLLVKKLKKIKK